MSYIIQQEDIDILLDSNWTVYSRIELLDSNFKTIDQLEGIVLSDSTTVDANSDVRRTTSLSFVVELEDRKTNAIIDNLINNKSSKRMVGIDSIFWINRFIKVYIGIKTARSNGIKWYNLGIFLFNQLSYNYDVSTRTLSLSCSDLMANFTGTQKGAVPSPDSTKIPVDSNIREAMVSAVSQLGEYKKYLIRTDPRTVPYDLEFGSSVTVYDVIKKLLDLYPGYEIYFDVDGTFICEPIPTLKDESVVLDETVMSQLVISEGYTTTFDDVRNVIVVWGKALEADRFAESSTGNGSQYSITLAPTGSLAFSFIEDMTIGFVANVDNAENSTLKINDLAACPLKREYVNDNYELVQEALPAGYLKADGMYVFKYSKNALWYQGLYQIHVVAKEVSSPPTDDQKAADKAKYGTGKIRYIVNPHSPYSVEKIGEIVSVKTDDDYDNIYTEELAFERAEYDLWLSTRLNDSITLEMVSIPWLDVNQKIAYTSLNTGETSEYIVNQISDLNCSSGTMSITAIKFYPLYPYTIDYIG